MKLTDEYRKALIQLIRICEHQHKIIVDQKRILAELQQNKKVRNK
jgi:hypothetical protein|tara:strand:+ start:68 stop:202 length:135 start_codon:yes stop_codon:yes gene_type:complete